MLQCVVLRPVLTHARCLQHKGCDDATMAQTWRLQRDKAYLDRAREIFVDRCASEDVEQEVANAPPYMRQQAEGQLRSRLAAMKRVTGTVADGTVRCLLPGIELPTRPSGLIFPSPRLHVR